MLAVDPLKRITIPDIVAHPFFTTELPRYLSPLPPPPGPVLGSLSSLVAPPRVLDFEIIEGLGKIEEDVVEELANRMEGVTKDDVWECLRRDDGVQGNAVKVAYMLLRDKRRLGKDCTDSVIYLRSSLMPAAVAEFAQAERDAQLAAMDVSNPSLPAVASPTPPQPRNVVSPSVLSPGGDVEANPFEAEFNAEYDEDEGEDDELDFTSPALPENEVNTFAVLNSSLPEQLPEQHHLTSYLTSKKAGSSKEKKQHKTKWHFGIRSRSPPMEVMLEIYRTLKTLGMEWKEKKNLGGLGGVRARRGVGGGIERAKELDGDGSVDLKAAAGIYFVETRARVQDVVVLMNLQLYMVDSINYLVDFHHRKSYRASTDPGAGKFDMAVPDPNFAETMSESSSGRSVKEKDGTVVVKEDEVVSPFVFMDVACRLILELAGGGE